MVWLIFLLKLVIFHFLVETLHNASIPHCFWLLLFQIWIFLMYKGVIILSISSWSTYYSVLFISTPYIAPSVPQMHRPWILASSVSKYRKSKDETAESNCRKQLTWASWVLRHSVALFLYLLTCLRHSHSACPQLSSPKSISLSSLGQNLT